MKERGGKLDNLHFGKQAFLMKHPLFEQGEISTGKKRVERITYGYSFNQKFIILVMHVLVMLGFHISQFLRTFSGAELFHNL